MAKVDFLTEVTIHVGTLWDHSIKPIVFHGVDGSRTQHARELKVYQKQVERLLNEYPRDGSESAAAWVLRVRTSNRDSGRLFGMLGRLHAIIERIDDEAELEAMRRDDAAKLERKAKLEALRREVTPDSVEVEALRKTIEAAKVHEELLASVFAAFAAHTKAQEARERLAKIFDAAESARAELQRSRETVSSKTTKRPTVPDAPIGAIEFARRRLQLLPVHPGQHRGGGVWREGGEFSEDLRQRLGRATALVQISQG